MTVLAVDFETTYTEERNIGTLGVLGYVTHPKTKAFLVSLYADDWAWVGKPEEAPWDRCTELYQTWVSHNAAFDETVYYHNAWCKYYPAHWRCTADMAARLQYPRALADVAKEILGVSLDKGVRDAFFGQEEPVVTKEIAEYCLADAKACYLVYKALIPCISETELSLSNLTRRSLRNGIAFDEEGAKEAVEKLRQALWKAEQAIPWAGELDDKGKPIPILSPKALARECGKLGITPPESRAKGDEDFIAWLEENEEKAPFVKAVGEYASVNRTLAVVEAMQKRLVKGRLYYSLKYCGAQHTGRWSGEAKLNLQNLTKKEVAGVNLRGLLVAGKGKKLIVADLSQIEPRVTLWLAGDTEQLNLIREGMDIYEAHARASMGYTGSKPLSDADPAMRQLAKARVLGLGYGMGAARFAVEAAKSGIKLTNDEARYQVQAYRDSNPKIVSLWNTLSRGFVASASEKDRLFKVEKPNGDTIEYMDVDGEKARVVAGGTLLHFYGGKLMENLVQATARDIFAEWMLNIGGHEIVLHVHDEVVVEANEGFAETRAEQIHEALTRLPDWCDGLPVATKTKIMERYEK